jgi:hypothetical protein
MAQVGRRRYPLIAGMVAAALVFSGDASRAQEVLFLHIRPLADRAGPGAGGSTQAALAAREAVWERSNASARIIIESVCDGCLGPWAPPAPKLVTAAAVSENPAPRGLESNPPLEASDATSEAAIPERRP